MKFTRLLPGCDWPRTNSLIPALAAATVSAMLLAVSPMVVAGTFDTDRRGGTDHPVLSRYRGSVLYTYGQEPLAPAELVFSDKGQPVLRSIEGRVNNRMYYAPKASSALEVFRNYQKALAAGGFEILYSCELVECEKQRVQPLIANLPRAATWVANDPYVSGIFNSGNQPGFHYISARRSGPGGVVHVQVGLSRSDDGGEEAGRVRQFVQVIEPARVEMDKVMVDAKVIGDSLQRDGKVALYGVRFDTNKAVIREDSAEQLRQMAQALKSKPSLKVYIVGHTDNQGELDANLALSHKRAQAVVEALTSRHGIAPTRMLARGVAGFSPVSSNLDEAGRARNRRVEMVLRQTY